MKSLFPTQARANHLTQVWLLAFFVSLLANFAVSFGELAIARADEISLPDEAVSPAPSHLVALDPDPNKPFVVSVEFTLLRLPREGRRVTILSKYPSSRKLSVGWGLFLRRTKTSIRPEIYWKGATGGGFYSMERLPFEINEDYVFTMVARPNEFVSLYVQPLNRAQARRAARARGSSVSRVAPEADSNSAKPASFMGGISIAETGNLSNPAPLLLGDARTDSSRLIGRINGIVVAYPEELPKSRTEIEKLVNGGPAALAARLPRSAIGFRYQSDSP